MFNEFTQNWSTFVYQIELITLVPRLDGNCDNINASNDESKVDLADTAVEELVDTDGGLKDLIEMP